MNSLAEQQEKKQSQIGESNDRINELLNFLEVEAREGKFYNQLGVDTDLVREIRQMLKNPFEVIIDFASKIPRAFVGIFWESIKKSDLLGFVEGMGVETTGMSTSIWLILKQDAYNFETKSRFFELKAGLANSPLFKKICVDLVILVSGEAEMPTSYTSLNLAA